MKRKPPRDREIVQHVKAFVLNMPDLVQFLAQHMIPLALRMILEHKARTKL